MVGGSNGRQPSDGMLVFEDSRVCNSRTGGKRRESPPPSPPDHFLRARGYEGFTSRTVQQLAVKSSSSGSLYDGWYAPPESDGGSLVDVRRTRGPDRHRADDLQRMDAGSSSNAEYVAYRLHRSAEHVAYRRSLQAVGAAQEASGVREVKSARSSDSFRSTKSWSSPQDVKSARSSPHVPATGFKSARSSDNFRSTKSSSSSRLPRAPVPAAEAAECKELPATLQDFYQHYQKPVYGEILKSAAPNLEIGQGTTVDTHEAARARRARRESRKACKREAEAQTPSAPSNSPFIASRQVKGPNPLTSEEEDAGRSGSRRIRTRTGETWHAEMLQEMVTRT